MVHYVLECEKTGACVQYCKCATAVKGKVGRYRMCVCVCVCVRQRVQFPLLLYTAIDFNLSDRRKETAPQPAAVGLRE